MAHIALGRLLVAGIILALLGVGGTIMSPLIGKSTADMRVEPAGGTRTVGDTFTVNIIVESSEPVNVFKGRMQFDAELLLVESINYNTSIADLWAEEPWYSNGDGTLNFIGGTTHTGGFTGLGTLVTVTFKTLKTGSAVIEMDEVRILQHNGLGTDVEVAEPIDAIFLVNEEQLQEQTVLQKSTSGPIIEVLPKIPSTDLNNDGKQSITDVSIFMQHLVTQNVQSDFNLDGKVSTADLSIILDAE